MNRQRLILFILAILFVIAAAWSYTAVPRPKTVSKLTYVTGQQVPPKAASPAGRTAAREVFDDRVLNLALLEQEHADFKGYRRNIFKPLFVDEQKLLKQKAAAFKPPQLIPVKLSQAVPEAPVATKPEAAALARFTFLGFLNKDNHKTIFLAHDKDILLVKKGDIIAGRYEASVITDQVLKLLVTDTGDEIVIPLIENRPLAAVK